MKGAGPLRFQRVERLVMEATWHRPSPETNWDEDRVTYVAHCGFTLTGTAASLRWSKAKRPVGVMCQSCERVGELRATAR